MGPTNIYSNIPSRLPDERVEAIVENAAFRLERIVSKGHSTPDGAWCDQERDEWVVVLKGSASLLIEGQERAVCLTAGDYLCLPAHLKHRVEWTDPQQETVWLALHY